MDDIERRIKDAIVVTKQKVNGHYRIEAELQMQRVWAGTLLTPATPNEVTEDALEFEAEKLRQDIMRQLHQLYFG